MNQVLEELCCTGFSATPDGRKVEVHSNIGVEEGELLQSLIREFRSSVTLEVGLGYGTSALFICEALRDVGGQCHIVIDPMQNDPAESWRGVGLYNVKRAGFESLIEFYEEPSFQVLPRLQAQGRRIDFALIDGWPTFDFKLVDFFFIDRLLNVGGVVVVRPGTMPSGKKLTRFIATNLAYRPCGGFPGPKSTSSAKRFLKNILTMKSLRPIFESVLKPEIMISDEELGLSEHLVAFRKEREDNRVWQFHHDF
jgi:hypothetical protein